MFKPVLLATSKLTRLVESCFPWPLLTCLAPFSSLPRTSPTHGCQGRVRPAWSSSYRCTPRGYAKVGHWQAAFAGWDTIQVAQALEVIQNSDGREGGIPHRAGASHNASHQQPEPLHSSDSALPERLWQCRGERGIWASSWSSLRQHWGKQVPSWHSHPAGPGGAGGRARRRGGGHQ